MAQTWKSFVNTNLSGTMAALMEPLTEGQDVPILTLYGLIPWSDPERKDSADARYRQQVVGAYMSKLNRILEHYEKPYKIRPGVARSTYRLYRLTA